MKDDKDNITSYAIWWFGLGVAQQGGLHNKWNHKLEFLGVHRSNKLK